MEFLGIIRKFMGNPKELFKKSKVNYPPSRELTSGLVTRETEGELGNLRSMKISQQSILKPRKSYKRGSSSSSSSNSQHFCCNHGLCDC